MLMIEGGRLVDSSDCIIMQPSGIVDINKDMIYAGDIVRLLDPGNLLLNGDCSGLGYIVFDARKAQFVWCGFQYYGFPVYSMSGKSFEIIGNVFTSDKRLLYGSKERPFDTNTLKSLATKEHYNFIDKFFTKNPEACERRVLIEKSISKSKAMAKHDIVYNLEQKKRMAKFEESRRMLKSIAEAKRKERYMKIYEQVKEELNGGKVCV